METHYLRDIRCTIGDIITKFNTDKSFACFYLLDTPEKRAVAVFFNFTQPRKTWMIRKLEQFGIMVLSVSKPNRIVIGNGHVEGEPCLMIIRKAEDIDIKGGS